MAGTQAQRRARRDRSAEWTGLAGVAFLGLVAYLVSHLGYEGPRGLRPYEIDGVGYKPQVTAAYDETGVASWYGDPFHGRRAANGTIYDQEAFTAAHKTLPLGTEVRVTNLENGRSALLRVTDRGPFVEGRIIDVSRRAARRLGFLDDGLAEVRVRALTSPLPGMARN